MSDSKKTTTTTVTRVNVREALDRGVVTPEEERVLRMRHGIGEKPSARLGLKGQENPEVRAKLAMIEQMAIEAMRQAATKPAAAATPVASRKAQILERLRRERGEPQ